MGKFISKQIHCGQYRRYGDFFRVWEIFTGEDKDNTLKYCFSELYKHEVPESQEWHKRIRYGNDKFGDADYYFAGYYTLEKSDVCYNFSVCEPYTD